MRLTSLSVKHVRVHETYELSLSPAVTLITGQNGSGKTSLIEAIYVVLQGTSFKGVDADILRQSSPWYRIDAMFESGGVRTVKFDPSLPSGKKRFEIDKKTNYRLTYANKYPVVLFEPDELRLLHGSPARRRLFIDRFISQLDPEYAVALRRYERALKQRNMLLKGQSDKNSMFVWDVALSEYGAYIIKRRLEVIGELAPKLSDIYKEIAHTADEVLLGYSNRYDGSIEQKLLSDLHYNAERDRLLGYTSTGPHRHDLVFLLNNTPAENTASRGEVRTVVLALKFLEVELLEQKTNKQPIILLDDVFSELDEVRQAALMEHFSDYQTIITSVSAPETKHPVYRLSI